MVEIEPYCILSLPYQSLADIVPCFHLVEKPLNHNFNVSLCVPVGECQELADPEGIERNMSLICMLLLQKKVLKIWQGIFQPGIRKRTHVKQPSLFMVLRTKKYLQLQPTQFISMNLKDSENIFLIVTVAITEKLKIAKFVY